MAVSPSPDRVRALRASLRTMLEDETVRRGLDQRERLEWLGEQLEHYVERWLGFAALSAVPESAALMKGDLFAMVEAGAGAVAEELSAVGVAADATAGWPRFIAGLEAVRKGDAFEPHRLRGALAEARAGFASAGW